jgi:ABC-2 type transport system ATP-binding protein
MITVQSVTKRYRQFTAVDDVTFTAAPGSVTGFLGPNGAGKSTTMRVIVGLTPPSTGTALVLGRRFADLPNPGREVGVLLDASAQHAGRSGAEILTLAARTMGLPTRRVDEMLHRVSLTTDEAGRRLRDYSLGMRQRLGIAHALLGDPEVLILDEPVNGLDPDGIYWFRSMLKYLAGQGRTVLVSSHLMSEMAQTADDLIVIGRGRLIAASTTEEFIANNSDQTVRVKAPDAVALRTLLDSAGAEVSLDAEGALVVRLIDAESIGEIAAKAGLVLHELSPQRASLEEAFMERTHDIRDYGGQSSDTPDHTELPVLVPDRSTP